MIEFLRGKIIDLKPSGAVLDVNGVGYGLELPLSTRCELEAQTDSETIDFWVHTHVREDALKLYGFKSRAEKELFEILISVNGVGPKLGLAILSTLDAATVKEAVLHENAGAFSSVPGIGNRMAEKILVELKSKLKKISALTTVAGVAGATKAPETRLKQFAIVEDAQSALENLGFKTAKVQQVLHDLTKGREVVSFNDLLREALIELGGGAETKKSAQKPVKSTESPTEIF